MAGRGGEPVESLRGDAPRLSDAFSRGRSVSVAARTGIDLEGYVCDRDDAGLLLDIRDPSGDPDGYEFLPWSSIERVTIRE
ncbi:MAG: hypothetical protein ACR2GU_13365 [Rubrobacteraceae bacterium]